MKVGIIGCGQIAKLHADIITKRPDVEIAGVADINIERAKILADRLGVKSYYRDAKQLIVEKGPEVVYILTSPQYHAELAIEAMNNGCHVLVEKPMALNLDDAVRMADVSKRTGLRLCVTHNQVFANVFRKAKNLASAGTIGNILSVEARFNYDISRNPDMYEEGAEYCHWSYRLNGGPVEDLIPHPASLLMEYISDIEDVKSVMINNGKIPEPWPDEVRIVVNSGKILGCIGISLNEKPDKITLTLRGTQGYILSDLYTDSIIINRKSALPRPIARGLYGFNLASQYLKGALGNIFKFASGRIDKTNGREQLISDFFDALKTGKETPISLRKCLNVMELTNSVWPSPMFKERKDEKVGLTPVQYPKGDDICLVTGATGFIGYHLTKKIINENVRVRVLIRPGSSKSGRLRKFPIESIEGDLRDREILNKACQGVKYIIHAGFPMGAKDDNEYKEAGILASKNLIDSAVACNVKRFVCLSSLTVYEVLNNKNKIINETCIYQQNDDLMGPYARAKIEIEKLAFAAHNKNEIEVTVLRPGIVIGPMSRVFYPHLGYRYQDKLFFPIGKGDTVLPLVFVENVVDGIISAVFSEKAAGEAYNLVDDGNITAKQFFNEFINATGTKAYVIPLPYIIPFMMTSAYEVGAYFGVFKKGVTSRAQLKWKQKKVMYDNRKAKKELDWKSKVRLEDGLAETFKWYASKYID